MIFIRNEDTVYMIEHVSWVDRKGAEPHPSASRWIPIFVCVDRDGNTHEINPTEVEKECTFIIGKEAEVLTLAFITVGDLPFNQRFVTEAHESSADHLEVLNTQRDIDAAIEHVKHIRGNNHEC